jgi:RecJ-like exonuclease
MAEGFKHMLQRLEELAQAFREAMQEGKVVRVVTHNDADGLSAGGIIHRAMLREGYPVQTRSIKQLEEEVLADLAEEGPEVVVFVDLGSGLLREMERHLGGKDIFILDHHQPREGENSVPMVNPHLYGIDGSREVSGAGVAYLFARALNKDNRDLADLAIVGAVGDIQDGDGRLRGVNQEILRDAVEAGVIRVEKDLRLFGRQTRPLYKAIELTTEPFIPGLSGSESACVQFLGDLDIPVKKDGRYTMLADLSREERKRLTTALILKMIEHKVPPKLAESIVGEVYTLLREEKRTPLRDAKEYATLLNGCGKHESNGVGLAVAMGERGRLYQRALEMLQEHKGYLANCYSWVSSNLDRIRDGGVVYYFHAGTEISENVIGTVASMVLNSRILSPIKPIIAFSDTEDGAVKVSARGTRDLIEAGLNLGKAMHYASDRVGGEGGGHDIAAGAKIEKGREMEFLKYVKEEIGKQLGPQQDTEEK